ncbi:MAG: CARDB domain-containing protein [Nitrospirota bacterium]
MKRYANKFFVTDRLGIFSLFTVILIFLTLPALSFAQDFTAKSIGDYGNVTVMEVIGNYDARNPDGSINDIPRRIIAKEFFRTHKDEYDFLVLFSNFDFQMPDSESDAFYLGVRNDTRGIGKPLFDHSELFGSYGKLQGIIDMGNMSKLVTDPLDPGFEETLAIISHEQMHRWGAYEKFVDKSGNISAALLGKDMEHWSFLLDTQASVLYGNKWQDNGNGTFTSIGVRKYYSPLDLYLMGFYDKSQVPPMLLIQNSDIDPARMPEAGVTINGTGEYITIDDIIAVEGERIPNPSDSQKTFKTAFILLTEPGTFAGYEIYEIENIRNGWVTRFSILTDGKGITEVTLVPREEIPTNPGIPLPPVNPRTLPPDIEDAVQWLMNKQSVDGSWMDLDQTMDRDTAEAVAALKNFTIAEQSCSRGIQWLNGDISENTDYLSRKIEALVNSGKDATALLEELVTRQNPDGGWGSSIGYTSNATDTSLALGAIAAAGISDKSVTGKVLGYLKTNQNPDGGWGSEDEGSTIEATSRALSVFSKYRIDYQLEDQISRGITWLNQRQNPDGGFGNSPSTIYDTAFAVPTLRQLNVSTDITNSAVNYMLNLQSENGSWFDSPHQTAVAISALWKAIIEPDLSVKAEDITFIPSAVKSLPAAVVIGVNIWNHGRSDVPQATVAIYDGAIDEAKKIGEQTLAFPGLSSVAVTFPVTIPDGNEHRFYIAIDPENLVKESNEGNNRALNIIRPETTYDFEILPSDVLVSQNPVDILQDVKIISKVANRGTMNAYKVQIKYFIDEEGIPFDIGTETVDIPANSTVSSEVTWRASKAGENIPITVFVDALDLFTEISEENNKVVTYLTVNSSTEPNLTISYKEIVITPNPASESGNATISIPVRNLGFTSAENIKVNFYKGVPGTDGILLGSQFISSLNAGESTIVSIDWTNISESGERVIYVQVDSDNQIREIREDDNEAFTTLKILGIPDLVISTQSISFAPPAPKEGDTVSINAIVQNKGEQGVSDITVRACEGNTIIDSRMITFISGYSQAATSFTYDTTGKSGAHQITIIVDPDNEVTERSGDNNTASKTFGVQDANLWLTEQYIAPNGDGIKDSTQFFFRLSAPNTVKVTVVNGKDETVRTFTGNEFANATEGNVTWDGLNEEGIVVNDGQYELRIIGENNTIFGSLLVVVDNNRSPLTDAIGTKYLLNTNLTCMLPDVLDENWQWFPDESGILLNIYYNKNTPEYISGLYSLPPDGEEIFRIISPESLQESNPAFDYSIRKFRMSPDGEKVAFILAKYNTKIRSTEQTQLWVVDKDGRNLTLLNSRDFLQEKTSFEDIKWSPDGSHIVFKIYNGAVYTEELWIMKSDGTGETRIEAGGWGWYWSFDFDHLKWSRDSRRFAYSYITYGADWNYKEIVKLYDLSGYVREIFIADTYVSSLEWLDDQKIVLEETKWGGYDYINKLWILNAGGTGNNLKISDDSKGEFSLSPDRQLVAFVTSVDNVIYLNISDIQGNTQILHRMEVTADYIPQINSIVWSPDNRNIALSVYYSPPVTVESVDTGNSRHAGQNEIVIVEKKTGEKNSFEIPDSMYLVNWLSDALTIIGYGYPDYGATLLALNTTSGDVQPIISKVTIPRRREKIVSPLEQHINYYKDVEQSSICYGRGGQDLWTLSSLLNLTGDLRITKEKSAVILKGIAADLHFEAYRLEYAPVNNPGDWNLIVPPSDVPKINDIFATWVPPYEGTFYIKLTLWDKAGNGTMRIKRVSWGLSSSIANLYKSRDVFSPNNDGIKDTVELYYRVLEPVHLEFNILNENNDPVMTIQNDHVSPGDNYVAWDGRDSGGRIVPDGRYKIKVFNYEFFVEVDNTPPDVKLYLKELMQDLDINTGTGSGEIYTGLYGHVYDSRLKNWIIEYGEGDNPEKWYDYDQGEEILVKKDAKGNPILDPVQDILVSSISESEIEFFVGKKLRITAEDFGGNKSTSITDYIEEKIILAKHWLDNRPDEIEIFPLSDPGKMFPGLLMREIHVLQGIETLRLPIVNMNVRYWSGRHWYDLPPISDPPSGIINIEWDNSHPEREFDAIRLKAIDVLGQEHYSNVVMTSSLFSIDTCNLMAANLLFENLKLLKIQIMSNEDNRYSQWTDCSVFDSARGDAIPEGTFTVNLPLNLESGKHYLLRMIGIGASGKVYESYVEKYPRNDCDDIDPVYTRFTLSVTYNESSCGLLSDGKAFLKAIIEDLRGNVSLKTLSYYIMNPDGLQLLRQIDPYKDGWGSVEIETSAMPEGLYPVKAVLAYLDLNDNSVKEWSAENMIIVDRVLPAAQITYPDNSALICPVKMNDVIGDWRGIHVEGVATDNTNMKRYELYYGIGENPYTWTKATTRMQGKDIPISATRQVKGQIGIWDVEDLRGTDFSLKLKVVDVAGNVGCHTTGFSMDTLTEITSVTADNFLFSPNGDGYIDNVRIDYQIEENATVDIEVFKLLKGADGSYVLDPSPVRTIVSALEHLGGAESSGWDGKDNNSSPVPDGLYGIAVSGKDSCENVDVEWIPVEVDNTPPAIVITFPGPQYPLGTIIEVSGTADDLNFKSYTLEAGQGEDPDTWNLIASDTQPIKDNVLGIWNTFGLEGIWTIRLTAVDVVGNQSTVATTIDLGLRKNLIQDLNASPRIFSPNSDGTVDTTLIHYALTDACQVTIDILDYSGAVKKTNAFSIHSAGTYSYIWDGKDQTGAIVPDGVYTFKLTAVLSSNTSVSQTEAVTGIIDITPPAMGLEQPLNNSYLRDVVMVIGTIRDPNLLEYSISYEGSSGTFVIDHSNQNRENYIFGMINEPPEGKYVLKAFARDTGENMTEIAIPFHIDRTPPKAIITEPIDGEYYGSEKSTVNIIGTITETNLESYALRYGSGENPSQWIDLQSHNVVPTTEHLFAWNVGKASGIPDGFFMLSLYARDKTGFTGESRVKILIDNSPPEARIEFPHDGGYTKGLIEIKGTAYDISLDTYTVEVSQGNCSDAYKWATLKTSNISTSDGVLAMLQSPPSDGDYCLKLAAIDKLGNRAESKVNIKVDTQPPASPVLSGVVENKSNINLSWTQNTEPDMAGYDIYRDGQKINTALVKEITYLEQNMKEGSYSYTVRAVDFAGNESTPSNEVKLRIDLTGPDAKISLPRDGTTVSGIVDIKGTAYSSNDFKQYRVYTGEAQNPAAWNLIRTSPIPIPYGTLVQWDTLTLKGVYSIKLEAEDLTGNITSHKITVTVDDTPPAAPLLISATANGSDVVLTWSANGESDLAGYLLFRNGQIANAPGIVIGDLKTYLITINTYLDRALPDGRFSYYLTAMDQAGNMSEPSNTLEVNIDTHAPRATIVEPADSAKFEGKIPVRAETTDLDISSIQFQYKKAADTTWLNLGNPVTQAPYTTYLDPVAQGFTYGDYNLRAVATDKSGKTDPSPPYIKVAFTDLASPNAPADLKAIVNGKDVTLAWTANTEADLNGYNMYRISGSTKTKINSLVIKETTYSDSNLSDGSYVYEVTAVDHYDNESKPSNSASVKIYAPLLMQPYTPTGDKVITIHGNKAEINSIVEVYVDNGSGPVAQGTTNTDILGNFAFDATLSLGENKVTAKAIDGAGNTSRSSEMVVVLYNEAPLAPAGLISSVQDYNVGLSWNSNTESDLSGYNIYRNGVRVNEPSFITAGSVSASSFYYYNPASYAFDSNPSTSWLSNCSYGIFNPVWLQINLSSAELINHLAINWMNESNAGKDYEIQVWSGHAWITQVFVTANTTKDNTFDFKPSYRTDRIRIHITDTTKTSYCKQVGISEIKIMKDNLIAEALYQDNNLLDGAYNYQVTAVDYYGFESAPSEEVKAMVGDLIPPSAPSDLTAAASASDVILTWSPNIEPDLMGYNLYRRADQGWIKINETLITINTYTHENLKNGTYTYVVTAVDKAGNESFMSNEVFATISVLLLQSPINLAITPVAEGGGLIASWEYDGTGQVAGYNIYRADTSGGPYTKINICLATDTKYTDEGLANGTTYYYVVTAVDSLGNESAYSHEAIGIPCDTVSPAQPYIYYPALSGKCILLYRNETSISGSAEPGSLIELFKDNVPIAMTNSLEEDIIQTFPLGSDPSQAYQASLSSDGETLAYTYNASVWLRDLSTGKDIKIVPQGENPLWSPDGWSIAYFYVDNNSDNRIGIYDIKTGSIKSLTEDTSVHEDAPSWSSDSRKIAFLSTRGGSQDAWIKDIVSGNLEQVTNGSYITNLKLSPDGKKLAFFAYGILSVKNLVSGNIIQIDTQTDGHYLDWSPDSKKIAFVSYKNRNADIFTYDVETQKPFQLTHSVGNEFNPLYSPDGETVVFRSREGNTGTVSIISADSPSLERVLKDLYEINDLTWIKSGAIAFVHDNTLEVVHIKGSFSFEGIQLEQGENIFSARSTDLSGNVSLSSTDVSVIYDISLMHDLEITDDDIFVYPPFPVSGEQVSVNIFIRNKGQIKAEDVDVEIYLLKSSGTLELLLSERIPFMESGCEEVICLEWDSSGNLAQIIHKFC